MPEELGEGAEWVAARVERRWDKNRDMINERNGFIFIYLSSCERLAALKCGTDANNRRTADTGTRI